MTARSYVLRDSGPARPRELTPDTETRLARRIMQCRNRPELDRLTKWIWREYGRGEAGELNARPLEQLKARILACRAILVRSSPR